MISYMVFSCMVVWCNDMWRCLMYYTPSFYIALLCSSMHHIAICISLKGFMRAVCFMGTVQFMNCICFVTQCNAVHCVVLFLVAIFTELNVMRCIVFSCTLYYNRTDCNVLKCNDMWHDLCNSILHIVTSNDVMHGDMMDCNI